MTVEEVAIRGYLTETWSMYRAYADQTINQDKEKHMTTETLYPMVIDGQKVRTGREVEVLNPATGEVFATAAQRAFPAWAATPLSERSTMTHKLADVLEARNEEIAELIVREQGQTLAEARGEAPGGIALARYMADNVTYSPVELRSDGDTRTREQQHGDELTP